VSTVPTLLAALDFLDPKHILEWLGPWATIGLFAIVFAESGLLIGFFLPGDSLLFTAGLLSSEPDKYHLHFPVLVIGCALFAVLGDQVGYMFGKRVGPALFRRPDSKVFKQEYVHRTKEFFEHHGPKTIFLARFVPIVRTFAPVLAGVGNMPYRTFIRYNVIGGVVWGAGIVTLGKVLGDRIDGIDKYLLPMVFVIVVLSLIPPFLEVRKHRKAARLLTAAEVEAEVDELEEIVRDAD
jgi:membrane-associated protein